MYPENPFAPKIRRISPYGDQPRQGAKKWTDSPALTSGGLENIRGAFPGYRGDTSLMVERLQDGGFLTRQQPITMVPTNPYSGFPVMPSRGSYTQPVRQTDNSIYRYGDTFPNGMNPERPNDEMMASPYRGDPAADNWRKESGFFADLLQRAMGELEQSRPGLLPSLYAFNGGRQARYNPQDYSGGGLQDPYRAFFSRLLS